MRRIKRVGTLAVALLAVLMCGFPAAHAQSSPATYDAGNYGEWVIQSQSASSYNFSPASLCTVSLGGVVAPFFAFATNAPLFIQDPVSANSEAVTPSGVIQTAATCGVLVSPARTHNFFYLRSGTGGLQEALNALSVAVSPYPAAITLSRTWYTQAASVPGTSPGAIIAAAKGSTSAFLVDLTTSPSTNYVWNGTGYVSGSWTNLKPTAAVGAGAGTSPTISNTGTANSSVVALTTGTSTTTGTLFTETWATTGSFLYAPTCAVTSTGANAYTTFTVATSYASSAATVTVTVATTAPTASTAYQFAVSCK